MEVLHRVFDSIFVAAFCFFLWWVFNLVPEIPHLQFGMNLGLWLFVGIAMIKNIWAGKLRFLRDTPSKPKSAPDDTQNTVDVGGVLKKKV